MQKTCSDGGFFSSSFFFSCNRMVLIKIEMIVSTMGDTATTEVTKKLLNVHTAHDHLREARGRRWGRGQGSFVLGTV